MQKSRESKKNVDQDKTKQKSRESKKNDDQDETKLSGEGYPATLNAYLENVLDEFQEIDSKEYQDINREIGDVLHQIYKPKMNNDTQTLSKEIFKILDNALGTKKTPAEAKNYKKLLAAVQKSKLLHPSEITALF